MKKSNVCLWATFDCSYCGIRSLDLSFCPELKKVNVDYSSLSSLNVDSTPALERLYCEENGLTSLDVSSCKAMIHLDCNDNSLRYLNVQNGNNTNMYLNAVYNGLTCIIVDDPVWAAANWKEDDHVPSRAFFRTDCEDPYLVIPDANFKAALVGNPAINTNGDGEIQETEAGPTRPSARFLCHQSWFWVKNVRPAAKIISGDVVHVLFAGKI